MAVARTPAVAARYDLTPRSVVLCAVVALALVTALDLIDGTLGLAFSVAFVLVSVSAATAVDHRGLFTAGVLPPALMVGALLVVAFVAPEAIVVANLPDSAGIFGRTLAGTIAHGVPLLVGHALALAAIVARVVSFPHR